MTNARAADFDERLPVVGQELPEPVAQAGRITADANIAVDEQCGRPSSRSQQRAKHVALEVLLVEEQRKLAALS